MVHHDVCFTSESSIRLLYFAHKVKSGGSLGSKQKMHPLPLTRETDLFSARAEKLKGKKLSPHRLPYRLSYTAPSTFAIWAVRSSILFE